MKTPHKHHFYNRLICENLMPQVISLENFGEVGAH